MAVKCTISCVRFAFLFSYKFYVADAGPAAGHTGGPGLVDGFGLLAGLGLEAGLRRPEGGRGRQEPGGARGLHRDRDGGC